MRIGRRGLTLLLLAATTAAGIAVFDWNWFTPAVERYFSEPSGRAVRISDLHVSLGEGFEPVVRVRGVQVQNAPWAGPEPLATAEEMRFQFAWGSLLRRRPLVISELTLIGADMQLSRRADGVRNWRLRRPDDTTDGRVLVQAVNAQRSRVHFTHAGHALVLKAEAQPAPANTPSLKGEALTRQIVFSGQYRGHPFEGEALTSDSLSLQQTGRVVPLRGQLRAGATRIDAEGHVADAYRPTALDAELQVRGPSLAAWGDFLPTGLPRSVPYTVTAHLLKDARDVTQLTFKGELGRSDLSGELSHDNAGERPRLSLTLNSQHLHLGDLHTAANTDPNEARLLSKQPFGTVGLRGLDAEITLRVQTLHLPGVPPLEGLRANARLDQGRLDIKPVQATWATGRINGQFTLDAGRAPPEAQAELQWQKLRLEVLMAQQPEEQRIHGPLSGRLSLSARGDSLADWATQASGSASAFVSGGTLPNRLDAKLALSGGRLLKALVVHDAPVAIHCGELIAELREGRAKTRHMVFETAQSRLIGTGQLDLHNESFELWFDPQPKKPGLLSGAQSIRVQGRLGALGQTTTSLQAPRELEPDGCDPGRPRAG